MEMEIIVAVKEENTMPENWRPASEMRALVVSYNNEVTHRLMNDTMEIIQKEAKNGATYCYVTSYCKTAIANVFTEILTELGYEVTYKYSGGKYVFEIHW